MQSMAVQQELVEQLFEAALALEPSARTAYLKQACGEDHALRQEVEDLLIEDALAGSLLEHPPVESIVRSPVNPASGAHTTGSIGDPRAPILAGSLSPGQLLIGRFVILRFIAKGGMGEVYEAEDRLLQCARIALKTILPEIAGQPAFRQRFEREVLLAREVGHPNLCPVHDIFHSEQPDLLFMTMKLLPGETLSARLRATPVLPSGEAMAILQQMAAGLHAIHNAGIIHRDIKPNNIMLEGSGPEVRLSITDFGLARADQPEHSLFGKGVVAGTPGYMAPELLAGAEPSRASDLFAFGVVLHQIFTGHKPTHAPGNAGVVVSPRLQTCGLPSFCVQLVTGCLAQDPERRCQAFARALPQLHIHYGTQPLWTRRRFAIAAVSLVGATAGTTWWKWNDIEDLRSPLPTKRFVALLNWPKTADLHVTPMLTSVLSAIKSELTHFETLDRDLFVVSPEDANLDVAAMTHLKEICDPLGANLVLAASGTPEGGHFRLLLRLLDPVSGRTLREKRLSCPVAEITTLPARAVRAAAEALNLVRYLRGEASEEGKTQSPEAFTAFQIAETLIRQGSVDAAIAQYKQATELDARYALAYAKLAQAYARTYSTHRSQAALDLAQANSETALALAPTLVESQLARAAVLQYTGNEQGALHAIAAALAIDPSNPKTLIWQAQIYNRLNRWEEAEKSFRRILQEHPNYWLAYNEFGYSLELQGRYREALKCFRAASFAAPGNSLAMSNLGNEHLQVGEFVEGTEILKKSLAMDPASDEAAVMISLGLRYQGKPEEALPFARKAVAMNTDLDTNWLELGDCCLALGNHQAEARSAYARAAKEAEQHLAMDAADGPAWMLLALYKVKSGSPQQGLSLIHRAESLAALDVTSQLYKGRTLEVLGKREAALACFAACFRKGATDIQVSAFPDMYLLRRDARYRELANGKIVASVGERFQSAAHVASGAAQDSAG
jgi:serine/threonine protein kinase/tetratricopeptide (TPR) repeat protein